MRKMILCGMALLLAASASRAQETSTEREAAPDVVKQIQQLEPDSRHRSHREIL